MEDGWIKLHRKILEWEHFKEPNVFAVFMAFLVSADRKTGTSVLSIKDLERLTGRSRKTVINAIKALQKSGEIRREILKNGSKTTINNFSKYQIRTPKTSSVIDTPSGGNGTPPSGVIDTPSSVIDTPSGVIDTPLPHYNNLQDYKKNNDDDARTRARERLEQEIMVDANIELACMSNRISKEQYKEIANVILAEWTFADLEESEWTKMHFLSVLRYKVNDLKRNGNNSQRQTPVTGQIPGRAQGTNPLAGYKEFP